jgi:hypothetical protein
MKGSKFYEAGQLGLCYIYPQLLHTVSLLIKDKKNSLQVPSPCYWHQALATAGPIFFLNDVSENYNLKRTKTRGSTWNHIYYLAVQTSATLIVIGWHYIWRLCLGLKVETAAILLFN